MTCAGGGHLASAQSLAEGFEGRAQVTFVNLLDEHARFPFNHLSDSYAPVIAIAPDLYRLAYNVVQTRVGIRLLNESAGAALATDMAHSILATEPDVVVSVHALLNSVPLAAMRETGATVPFVSVVVDAGIPPRTWFDPGVALCCVADESIAAIARDAGIPRERIEVTGLPIRRAFTEVRNLRAAEARRLLGIDPQLPLVLVLGGGAGMGRIARVASAVAERLGEGGVAAQLCVVAGANERLRERLERRTWPVPVTVLGFTDRIAEWMAAADVLLSKAGPGSIAEAACLGVPTLLWGFVPGQEQHNVEWAQRLGGAAFERDPHRAAELVEGWLRDAAEGEGSELRRMSERMAAMGRPFASRDIADAIMRVL
jgi:1,2-diacylglycerol 3-beta-galactosyltransferase